MADVQPIRSEAEHEAALGRIYELMDAQPGTPEGCELDALVTAVERYESQHEPMGYPDPAAAIQFRMEQADLSIEDLISCIGSRAETNEVLAGKRVMTLPMARAIHERLGIPVETLLETTSRTLPDGQRMLRP